MHASIAFCLMMVGGPISPEPDIIDVPLVLNPYAPTAMEDMESKERNKRYKLPRVPTLGDDRSMTDDGTGMRGRLPPTNPYAPQRRATGGMPMSPTDPGSLTGGPAGGPLPALPGTGTGTGYEGQGNTSSGGRTGYTSPSFTQPVKGNYGGLGVQTTAQVATRTPMASDSMNGIMNVANMTGLGVPQNPLLNNQKPFTGYQAPSGYSPWMSLYNTPTNNGTVSTYANTVQPQMQQQAYNHQVAEQIQGVRNLMVAPAGGTPGQEQPMGGGLANPNAFLNYGNYYPQMNH